MVAMDAYAAFLVGACHTLGSPLGALLSNVALAREDLADALKALREGPTDPASLLSIVERAHSDLGDAQRLIDRLKLTLIEVRSAPSEPGEETSTNLLDVFEAVVKFAVSSTFRDARVTTKVEGEANRRDFLVRGDGSLVLRLLLGMFAVVASMPRERKERSLFQIGVESNEERVSVRVEGTGLGFQADGTAFQTFAEMFVWQGGRLSSERQEDSCVVMAEFARYAAD